MTQKGDLGVLLDEAFKAMAAWLAEQLSSYGVPLTPAVGRGAALRFASMARTFAMKCSVTEHDLVGIMLQWLSAEVERRTKGDKLLTFREAKAVLEKLYDKDSDLAKLNSTGGEG